MEKKVYSVDGKELRTINLDDNVFGLPVNEDVIYYAINNELANLRVGTACTKTRAEVHGSNAKPYKQKGTGRARAGAAGQRQAARLDQGACRRRQGHHRGDGRGQCRGGQVRRGQAAEEGHRRARPPGERGGLTGT